MLHYMHYITKEVEYHCISKSDSTNRNLKQSALKQILNAQVNEGIEDFQEKIQLKCTIMNKE